jgi:hypothetical protein
MLERVRMVARVDDALRELRPVYHVAEPFLRLHHLVIRPYEARLVGASRAEVWRAVAPTVASLIEGPHLEELARYWCLDRAATQTLGGLPTHSRSAVIACPEHRKSHEVDVVVGDHTGAVLAIGEVKATRKPIDTDQLRRLEHIRTLLPSAKVRSEPRLLLFGRNGFTPELSRTADGRDDVQLVDLERLYRGD